MNRTAKRFWLAALFVLAVTTLDVRAPTTPQRAGVEGTTVTLSLVPKAHAGLLDDPIGHVWSLFRERVLDKIWAVIAKPFNDVKNRLEGFINDARKKMETIFFDHVLAPAMKTAMKFVFLSGEAGRKQVAQAVATYIGSTDAMLERVSGFEEAALAIAERSLVRLESAKRIYNVAYGRLKSFDKTKLMDIIMPSVRDKLENFVHAETIGLVEIAWAILEKPVELALTAAKGAITVIPVIGSVASAIFGALTNVALTVLRGVAVEFVSEGVSRLTMLAIDALLDWVRTKKAAEQPWLKGVFQTLDETFGKIEAVVAPAIKAYERFGTTLHAIEAALKDSKMLGTRVERRYAGGLNEGQLNAALGQLRDARSRVEDKAAKSAAAARTKLEKELQAKVVWPSFTTALSQVLGDGGKNVLKQLSRRLTGDLDSMVAVDQAAGLAMQSLMAADDKGLQAAEQLLKQRRDALTKLDYAAIKAELARRITEPVASITVARAIERADATLQELIDESLRLAGTESQDEATNMLAGFSQDRARTQRRELEAVGRALVINPELGRALVEETLRAAGGARNVSAPALAAGVTVREVVGKVRARVTKAGTRIQGLIDWIVRARKDLAAAAKGGK